MSPVSDKVLFIPLIVIFNRIIYDPSVRVVHHSIRPTWSCRYVGICSRYVTACRSDHCTQLCYESSRCLLPELQKGLFDGDWRIRLSSINLISNLFARLTGMKENTDEVPDKQLDDDEEAEEETMTVETPTGEEPVENIQMSISAIQKKLVESLGAESYEALLSGLYILRFDFSGQVRQATLKLWKSMVLNTPKKLREIMPQLIRVIIENLSSSSQEVRRITVRAVEDVSQKIPEKLMADAMPIFNELATSTENNVRFGVFSFIKQVVSACTSQVISEYSSGIVEMLQGALADEELSIREFAAQGGCYYIEMDVGRWRRTREPFFSHFFAFFLFTFFRVFSCVLYV